MSNIDLSKARPHLNIAVPSRVIRQTSTNGISSPKDYLYALQNENLFSENDYNDDLNNELVQAIEYYESLNAVPLRFSSLSQEQIGKTKTEIHGSLNEQLENMGEKYKRRRPCEVILEEEVAEAERMEQPANSKIQRKADTREEQIIKREGQAKKKVKRQTYLVLKKTNKKVEVLEEVREVEEVEEVKEEAKEEAKQEEKVKKLPKVQEIKQPQYYDVLMDYMKEQVDNFKHVPGQIRGDFSVYDSYHTLLYSSKTYKPGSSERVAGKRKMIVKAGDENKQKKQAKTKENNQKKLRKSTPFLSSQRCKTVIKKYQLLL